MENNQNELYIEKLREIKNEVSKVIIGKDDIIDKVIVAVLAGGHILLEDIPGVGKTTLALALSKATNLEYNRTQFTPDVLPTDVTGFSVYDKKSDSFVYKKGAALCNLFLADEINRTSSKTQSALLEIMEEGNITVDGVTHEIPKPFIVIATQNPIGYIGTQMLPESQLDRFSVRLSMGYPNVADEVDILKGKQGNNPLEAVKPVASAEDIFKMQKEVQRVYTDDKIFTYIVALADETRKSDLLTLGISPRGTVAIASLARAKAFYEGRDYVIPDDVTSVFLQAAEHRITLSPKAKISGASNEKILTSILQNVKCPGIN